MNRISRKIIFLIALSALLSLSCISLPSIPFIGGGGGEQVDSAAGTKKDFPRNQIYGGYDDDGNLIVEMRLVSQEITPNGLIVNTRLFPTDNFKVRHQFRGLRSIDYYEIERRFHRLELRYGRRKTKMKVLENVRIKEPKPVDAKFEHTGIFYLLPDSINRAELKFQDVDKWKRLPEDSLDQWYADKAVYLKEVRRETRRQDLLQRYQDRLKDLDNERYASYDSLFVSTNNTYVFLNKNTESEKLYVMNAGDRIDFGVSDGIWVEFPVPDSLMDQFQHFAESRKRQALSDWKAYQERLKEKNARRQAGGDEETEIDTTLHLTAYVLDAMVNDSKKHALNWEKREKLKPVDVPLFAKVLQDRTEAEITRRDSIAKAVEDSIAHELFVVDSLKKAVEDSVAMVKAREDSLAQAKVDSIAAVAKAREDSIAAVAKAREDSVSAAAQKAAQPAAAPVAADSVQQVKPAVENAQPADVPKKPESPPEGNPQKTEPGAPVSSTPPDSSASATGGQGGAPPE